MHCMIHMMHVAAHDGARPPCKCKGPAIRCTSCYCCHHQPIQPCTCTAAHIPNSPTTTPPTATPVGCCPHHHSHTQPAATISAATFAASMFTAATSAAALIDPQQSLAPMHPPSPRQAQLLQCQLLCSCNPVRTGAVAVATLQAAALRNGGGNCNST